jgi:hypothetical protein
MCSQTGSGVPTFGSLPKPAVHVSDQVPLRPLRRTRVATACLLASMLACAMPAANADTVAIGLGRHADLADFVCHDFQRSRIVHRVCYDAGRRRMLVRLRRGYFAYCNVEGATVAGLEAAASMGQFLSQHVKPALRKHRAACAPAEFALDGTAALPQAEASGGGH